MDLAFAPQVAIRGHVTRGTTPIAGATVGFTGAENGSGTTGQDGTYTTTLDAGDYDVTLIAIDRRPIPFAQHISIRDAGVFDFVVDATTIAAAVVDADTGLPLAGAHVGTSKQVEATANADGIASLEAMRGDEVTIIGSKHGYANASETVTASENTSITLRLHASAGAAVRIIDVRDGRTLTGFLIARDAAGRVVASAQDQDADGTATLALAPGKYQFSASADGYGSHTITAEVPSGEIRVPLPRGGNVLLRSTNGVHATARLIQSDGQPYVRCWCNSVAAIEINGLATMVDRVAPGAYTLEVGKSKQIPVTVIEGQTTTVSID